MLRFTLVKVQIGSVCITYTARWIHIGVEEANKHSIFFDIYSKQHHPNRMVLFAYSRPVRITPQAIFFPAFPEGCERKSSGSL